MTIRGMLKKTDTKEKMMNLHLYSHYSKKFEEATLVDRDLDELDGDIEFIFKVILNENDDIEHLPVPVYSYIKLIMGPQFILHIILSMGYFSIEIVLTHHTAIREFLRSAKLIDNLDDEHSLQEYPNNKRAIDS